MARPGTNRAKKRRKRTDSMIAVKVHLECGCCDVIMHFTSIEDVEKAFEGELTSSRQITDSIGMTENVDTFYGYHIVS